MMIYFTQKQILSYVFFKDHSNFLWLTIYYKQLWIAVSAIFLNFFTINLFSLINGEAVLLYHHSPHCWIEWKGNRDHVFAQVSVGLSDATHRNMNQKYVFFKKNTLISNRLSMLLLYTVFTFYNIPSQVP